MTEPHEPTHNPNIFHQIATDTNLKILNPTEYNQIKQKQPKTNQHVITTTSQESVALYQTIQLNRKQLQNIQSSNLISNKRKLKLIKNINDIDNKQSTLQTFGFKGSTTIRQNKTLSQQSHMTQTTLTDIITSDENKPFGDRLKKKNRNNEDTFTKPKRTRPRTRWPHIT